MENIIVKENLSQHTSQVKEKSKGIGIVIKIIGIIIISSILLLLAIGFINQFKVTNEKTVMINYSDIYDDETLIKLINLTDNRYKKNTNIVVIKKEKQLFSLFLQGKIPLTFGEILNYYFDKEKENLQGRTISIDIGKGNKSYWVYIFENSKVFDHDNTVIKEQSFLRVLYHELRHVYQFKEDNDMVAKNRGVPYNLKPYEIDAEEFQEKFIEENKYEIYYIIKKNISN